VSNDICQPRISSSYVIRVAHTTANTHVVSHKLIVIRYSDQTNVLRIDIDVIDGRDYETYLELSRQIRAPIHRLFLKYLALLLPLQPDFTIGAGPGDEPIADLFGNGIHLPV